MKVGTHVPTLQRPPDSLAHTLPSATATGDEQVPFDVSQVPGVWQSSAVQTTGSVPVQIPL
jgi:hypothetical protein